jgi:hypothetical protein
MLPRPKRLTLVKCVVESSETLGTGLQTPSRLLFSENNIWPSGFKSREGLLAMIKNNRLVVHS